MKYFATVWHTGAEQLQDKEQRNKIAMGFNTLVWRNRVPVTHIALQFSWSELVNTWNFSTVAASYYLLMMTKRSIIPVLNHPLWGIVLTDTLYIHIRGAKNPNTCTVICHNQPTNIQLNWNTQSKLTLRACMATCGTLWFTLFMIDLRLSFALKKEQNDLRLDALLCSVKIKQITLRLFKSLCSSEVNELLFLKGNMACPCSPIGRWSNPITDVHDEPPVICCVVFIGCLLWKCVQQGYICSSEKNIEAASLQTHLCAGMPTEDACRE